MKRDLLEKQLKENKISPLVVSPAHLFAINGSLELIFYLPNRFRQTLLTNSLKINFTQMDKALLDLMNDMFSIRIDGPVGGQKFSLYNFVYCYKHIFRSTLLYEGVSLSMR